MLKDKIIIKCALKVALRYFEWSREINDQIDKLQREFIQLTGTSINENKEYKELLSSIQKLVKI